MIVGGNTSGDQNCLWKMAVQEGCCFYKSEFYEESSLYGQMPAKILADVTPK